MKANSYDITSFGVAVINGSNFVRSKNVQEGVRKFRELAKMKKTVADPKLKPCTFCGYRLNETECIHRTGI